MSALSCLRAVGFILCFLPGKAWSADLNFYLRCASTSLDIDAQSRMKVTAANPRIISLSFENTALNEDCTLTETDGLDTPGSEIFDYNLNFRNILANGEQTWIGNPAPRPAFFRIDYEELGQHTAFLDLDSRFIWLEKAEDDPGPEPEPESFFYLLCNTTSWLVNDKSRFKPDVDGLLSVAVNIPRNGFSELCTLSETPEKNAWGAWQIDYDLDRRDVFEGFSFALGKAADERPFHFKIDYTQGGPRKIYLNLRNRRMWIGLL